jgi:hypothetical protein
MMNDSLKFEIPLHVSSDEGSKVVQRQIWGTHLSETMDEIDSTGEQGESYRKWI